MNKNTLYEKAYDSGLSNVKEEPPAQGVTPLIVTQDKNKLVIPLEFRDTQMYNLYTGKIDSTIRLTHKSHALAKLPASEIMNLVKDIYNHNKLSKNCLCL